MSLIPDFPQKLLDEHKKWHHARHQVNINNPPPGYGQEFLRFHRDYITRALAWYKQAGHDPRLVEPWVSVPEEIRQAPCFDQAAEARILYQPESFVSADELGRFIESSNLHACIHQQSAQLYGDPDIDDFDVAPHDTVFYNIHGMIDRWWKNWEGMGRFSEGQSYWCGAFDGEGEEVLYYSLKDGYWWLAKVQSANSQEARDGSMGQRQWISVGNSSEFGPMDDGRLFRIWDVDGDGKLEVLFRHPRHNGWVEGKVKEGTMNWQPISLHLIGPSLNP
ncbi:tyrosinase family protein [Cohnella abietis]|uniref:Tyrosinase copper-binding domain-containing protein n=1 Tax=Cohnella abietis TaxID=2507935 RepID=A0A3T1D022_9BACL|nr:tyrosinase family protein [Cohnella abietis]BBI31467.1 hypothetical protein KCTCHS21_08660 [Cohnella abietis]